MLQGVVKPWLGVVVVPLLLTGCMVLDNENSNTPLGAVAIAYTKRDVSVLADPTISIKFAPGGDLFIKDLATAGAPEKNITAALTRGDGDVQGPEPDFSANKILFSMRCGHGAAPECANDNTWNIWEYDVSSGALHRIIRFSESANQGDDLDPAYLPDGRIVFASNRQQDTRARLSYRYVDGERKEFAFNLHVMNADGSHIEQITFGLGHDRYPTVMRDGRVLFSRWDRSAQHSKISLYTVRPDGRVMMPYYGAHSPGGGFLQPREMADGRLVANVTPLSGTYGGGALMAIDARDFGDENDPAPNARGKAQWQVTVNQVPLNSDYFGETRYAFPFPLNDGSGRILVSVANKPDSEGALPRFRVAMLDPKSDALQPIVLPADSLAKGDMRLIALEAIVLAPIAAPPILPRAVSTDTDAMMDKTGIINVKSVYDVDGFGYVGSGMLTEAERSRLSIPTTELPGDIRGVVVDIAKVRDPRYTPANQRPARFVRLMAAVPLPMEVSPAALSGTPMGPKTILGYLAVEPDGSVRARVPADVPLAMTVLDEFGRAFVDHDDWFQVRPGEELVCNGCHSYKRLPALNTGASRIGFPNSRLRSYDSTSDSSSVIMDKVTPGIPARVLLGETMAEMRTRVDPMAMMRMPDLHFVDVWTWDDNGNVEPNFTLAPPIHRHYKNLPGTVPAPEGGIIDYVKNIQAVWETPHRVRNGQKMDAGRTLSCAYCHDPTRVDPLADNTLLDLRGPSTGNINAATNRAMSYDQLLRGKIEYDPNTNYPYYSMVDGRVILRRSEPLVIGGRARASKLVEILTGKDRYTGHEVPPDLNRRVDHSIMLGDEQRGDASERLVVYEWIDIGAQYYNNLRDEQGNFRAAANRLSPSAFLSTEARRVLYDRCSGCHKLLLNGALNRGFQASQFILTGNFDDDYIAASSMVDDLTQAENSRLLRMPTSIAPQSSHPSRMRDINGVPTPVPQLDLSVPSDAQDYQYLLNWAKLGGL